MNILLTLKCSLNCDYCFARSRRAAHERQELTFADLEQILAVLDPDRDPVRLLGGEPTLHSRYPEVLASLKARGFRVIVFTNGLQPILRETAPLLPDEILLNLNDWQTYSARQQTAIRENLAALGPLVGLGYTITDPGFDLSCHRQLTLEMGLRPVIRLGLAQPIVGGENRYLPDEDLPAAHRAVSRWAQALAEDGIRLNLDCGFMRCYFTDADLEALVRAGTRLNFDCRPTLDVGPGLRVWRCFGFSHGLGLPWEALRASAFELPKETPPEDCAECSDYLKEWCRGGCLARRMKQRTPVLPLEGEQKILKNVGTGSL